MDFIRKVVWFYLALTFTFSFVGLYYLEYIKDFVIFAGVSLVLALFFIVIGTVFKIENKIDKIQSSIKDKRGIV